MSAASDAQRREDAVFARVERAKATLRQLQVVVTAETEGVSFEETARRLGVDSELVAWLRYCVGLVDYGQAVAVLRRRLRNAEKRGRRPT